MLDRGGGYPKCRQSGFKIRATRNATALSAARLTSEHLRRWFGPIPRR
jgi:hypothetical protein